MIDRSILSSECRVFFGHPPHLISLLISVYEQYFALMSGFSRLLVVVWRGIQNEIRIMPEVEAIRRDMEPKKGPGVLPDQIYFLTNQNHIINR
jgi:hypothetical protein